MNAIGQATFATKNWDEKPYSEIDAGRKLNRVQATFTYNGDIEGEGTLEYLMAYSPDGTGSFVGLERIVGRIGNRSGSFVAQHTGTFDPKSVSTHWEFVPGLGTEALEGLVGGGELKLEGHGPYPFSFQYDFDQ
ncbi:MAG: DUF3224 domain-containing protein [Chloroflexi bacterium HGW-Chloroflexi-6]|nr:MAG: DUF3224 domain-containing protein [Chloroflexi bacterium HGW-Chloroflexi-6]